MTLADAAVWPDHEGRSIRDFDPLHYVRIPENAGGYDQGRDCPEKNCMVEALKWFSAAIATRTRRPWCGESRFIMSHIWWGTCTSRSTPVEQGRGDQGRVDISVSYGVTTNLHYFWDSDLVEMETGSEEDIAKQLTANLTAEERLKWQAGDPIAVDQ